MNLPNYYQPMQYQQPQAPVPQTYGQTFGQGYGYSASSMQITALERRCASLEFQVEELKRTVNDLMSRMTRSGK